MHVFPLWAQETLIEQYLAKAEVEESQGDKRQATYYLNKAAAIQWEKKKYDEAILYYKQSVNLNQEIGNENGIAMINNNIGMIYADMQAYESALPYFQKTLTVRKQRREKSSIIHTLINLSVVFNNLKRHNEAGAHLEEALALAQELNDIELMRSCYGMLAETYDKANNTKKSIEYFNLYRSFHELEQREKAVVLENKAEQARLRARLLEAEARNKELELESKEKTIQQKDNVIVEAKRKLSKIDEANRDLLENASKQDLIISVLEQKAEIQEKDTEIKEAKLKELQLEGRNRSFRERIIRYALLAGTAFLAIILGILYFRYREKQRTNFQLHEQNEEIKTQKTQILTHQRRLEDAFEEISKQHKDIKSSINYAQRIQGALLEEPEKLQLLLPESFIFFRPRDVVSGDFYWFTRVEGKTILAAVDCTGHGVPGALMSMLGSSFLRQITNRGIYSPHLILNILHEEIHEALHQGQKKLVDGMDMALVCIDSERKEMSYAGAHNPLVYVQNNTMHIIKGNRFTVGGSSVAGNRRDFTEHTIDISVPTQFYIYSDGYQDQFGGLKGRKFMTRQLRDLLLEISQCPLEDQSHILSESLDAWQGERDQVDDILVIGARVG